MNGKIKMWYYPYNGILFSNKKKTLFILATTDGAQILYQVKEASMQKIDYCMILFITNIQKRQFHR